MRTCMHAFVLACVRDREAEDSVYGLVGAGLLGGGLRRLWWFEAGPCSWTL